MKTRSRKYCKLRTEFGGALKGEVIVEFLTYIIFLHKNCNSHNVRIFFLTFMTKKMLYVKGLITEMNASNNKINFFYTKKKKLIFGDSKIMSYQRNIV